MKKLLLFLFILLVGSQLPATASDIFDGEDEEYEFNIQDDGDSDIDDNRVGDPGHRHKSKGEMFHCVISRHGVTVNGADITNSIAAYEVTDEEGNCIAASTDRYSFIDTLHSLPSGVYLLKLRLTTGSTLSGWLYL